MTIFLQGKWKFGKIFWSRYFYRPEYFSVTNFHLDHVVALVLVLELNIFNQYDQENFL